MTILRPAYTTGMLSASTDNKFMWCVMLADLPVELGLARDTHNCSGLNRVGHGHICSARKEAGVEQCREEVEVSKLVKKSSANPHEGQDRSVGNHTKHPQDDDERLPVFLHVSPPVITTDQRGACLLAFADALAGSSVEHAPLSLAALKTHAPLPVHVPVPAEVPAIVDHSS